jgi:hypothetical protein
MNQKLFPFIEKILPLHLAIKLKNVTIFIVSPGIVLAKEKTQ